MAWHNKLTAHDILRTPSRYNTSQPDLFRVVCYVWSKTENYMTEVPIRALHDLWCHRILLEWWEDYVETGVIQLVAEHLKICPFLLVFAGLDIINPSANKKVKSNILFGMGRKATGTIPFPCPCQAVFLMFPIDAYTGWYSWPPVTTDTVVLSLPVMIGMYIDPCIVSSWEIVS